MSPSILEYTKITGGSVPGGVGDARAPGFIITMIPYQPLLCPYDDNLRKYLARRSAGRGGMYDGGRLWGVVVLQYQYKYASM